MYLSRWVPHGKTMEHEMLARRALCTLPVEIQHQIATILREPPPAPRKPMSARLRAYINRWKDPNRPKIAPLALFF